MDLVQPGLHAGCCAPLKVLIITAWCSVLQSCKPLSLFSFRVIVILLSCLSVGSCVSVFYFFLVSANFLKQFLSVCWFCKLFDKALVVALARGALAMCLQLSIYIFCIYVSFIINNYNTKTMYVFQ
jgi:hypothetical protein